MNALAPDTNVQVPRIERIGDQRARVTRWGKVDGLILRPGDELRLASGGDGVLLLSPTGRGRPMLAERQRGRLVALPARVPVGLARWRVSGWVVAVDRALERGAPAGHWSVVVRVEPLGPDADVDGARQALGGGVMDGRGLDALCLRASLAPRRFGVRVAVAAAASREQAVDILAGTETDHLAFSLAAAPVATGRVIVGPWPVPAGQHPPALATTHCPEPGVRRRPAAQDAVAADDAPLRRTRARRRGGVDPQEPGQQVLLPFAGDTRKPA